MKTIIKIAILTFLLKNVVSRQGGINQGRTETSDVDWLTGLTSDRENEDMIRWFLNEKAMDTETRSMIGKKVVQIWLPVKTTMNTNNEFVYFCN